LAGRYGDDVRRTQDPGNPDPELIRRWHIPNPYNGERCTGCMELLVHGELINIEYEAGVMHAACGDRPYQARLAASS